MNLLMRTVNVPGVCTLGTMYLDGAVLFRTAEREWLNNKKNVSCVPAGDYDLVPHVSPSKGECFALVNPNLGVTIHGPSQRTHCLIHVANFPHQLEGCIAVGMGFYSGNVGVKDSKDAMQELKRITGGKSAKLTIERSMQ